MTHLTILGQICRLFCLQLSEPLIEELAAICDHDGQVALRERETRGIGTHYTIFPLTLFDVYLSHNAILFLQIAYTDFVALMDYNRVSNSPQPV